MKNKLRTSLFILMAYMATSFLNGNPNYTTAAAQILSQQTGKKNISQLVAEPEGGSYSSNQLVVKFKANDGLQKSASLTGIAAIDGLNQKYGATSVSQVVKPSDGHKSNFSEFGLDDIYVIQFGQDQDISALVKEYERTGAFVSVTPSYQSFSHANLVRSSDMSLEKTIGAQDVIPNDEHFNLLYALLNDGTNPPVHQGTVGIDIGATKAWEITQGDSSIVIGFIDSGLNPDHPELKNKVYINEQEIPNNGIDDDGNGKIDDYRGWNFFDENNDIKDIAGYGTATAGVIVAEANNNFGLTGVDWNAKLLVLKVMEDYIADQTDVMKAVIYAVDNGADIIYYSGSSGHPIAGYREVFRYAYDHDVPVVCPVGMQSSILEFPAEWFETINSGSVDNHGDRQYWSNRGDSLDIVMPGEFIYVLWFQNPNDYSVYGYGTSYSAAYTTGVVSLLKAVNKSLKPDQIKEILHKSAVDMIGDSLSDPEGPDPSYGFGMGHAFDALKLITAVEDHDGKIPADFNMSQNYPNPFNPNTTIEYQLGKQADVNLSVYNINGQVVENMEFGRVEPGDHTISFDGSKLPSGVYFYQLKAGDRIQTNKMVLLK